MRRDHEQNARARVWRGISSIDTLGGFLGSIALLVAVFTSAVVGLGKLISTSSSSSLPGVESLAPYWPAALKGLATSLYISGLAILFGTIAGGFFAYIMTRERRGVSRYIARIGMNTTIYILLGMPLYTGLLLLYYWIRLPEIWIASLALAINLSPFAAKIIAAGIDNTGQLQIEAARALGYHGLQLYRKFYIPSIIRSVGQPLLVQWFTTFKLSSLAAIIGVTELMHTGQGVIRETYQTGTIYLIVACLYVVVVFPVAWGADRLQAKSANKRV